MCIELFLLSLAFNHYSSFFFFLFPLPSVALGCAERQGLLENIFHKTTPKAEMAQVRVCRHTLFVSICACTYLLIGLRIKVL